jgi:hypothetical protein
MRVQNMSEVITYMQITIMTLSVLVVLILHVDKSMHRHYGSLSVSRHVFYAHQTTRLQCLNVGIVNNKSEKNREGSYHGLIEIITGAFVSGE